MNDYFNALRPRISALAEKFNLDLVVAFGSMAHGITHAASDLDLAVQSSDGSLSFEKMARLYGEFELCSGRAVSVVDLHRADPLLLSQIAKHAVPLHGTNLIYSLFMLRSFRRFEDYRPFLELEGRTVSRWVREHHAA